MITELNMTIELNHKLYPNTHTSLNWTSSSSYAVHTEITCILNYNFIIYCTSMLLLLFTVIIHCCLPSFCIFAHPPTPLLEYSVSHNTVIIQVSAALCAVLLFCCFFPPALSRSLSLHSVQFALFPLVLSCGLFLFLCFIVFLEERCFIQMAEMTMNLLDLTWGWIGPEYFSPSESRRWSCHVVLPHPRRCEMRVT